MSSASCTITSGISGFTVNQVIGTVRTPEKNNDHYQFWTLKGTRAALSSIHHFVYKIEMHFLSFPSFLSLPSLPVP